MAELASSERLQPSLLDRLTDHEPDKSVEARDQRVLSLRALRQGVLRDLAWLLNTTKLIPAKDSASYPIVANSVLNFGMPDISGVSLSGLDLPELERSIRQAVWDFEPRIIRNTVVVKAISADHGGASYNKVIFEIEGDMWAQPYPERLYLRTELDMEGSAFSISESTGRA